MRNRVKRKFIENLVPMILEGQVESAAEKWREYQRDNGCCSDVCPFGDGLENVRCARCLEGRLRALTLVTSVVEPEACVFAEAARAIHLWFEDLVIEPSCRC